MKLDQKILEVERSGEFQETEFAIANNSKAFDILSSKIYSDIPRAIIRELSTNASDSHMDAGCSSKPFDVHLPNSLEPWLTIRDYGTGLSPSDVKNVYTTYFRSTRTNSDSFTGCLGLGSKSPFAYTDQFTITTVFNGRRYVYSAFKNEQGCPTIALLSETDTNESNGLDINIAIKRDDFSSFIEAAQTVYQHFDVRPNITGAHIVFDTKVVEFQDNNYSFGFNTTHWQTKIYVVMGQVCYNVDIDKINCSFSGSCELFLKMPIGSCAIAASREELHYDNKTIHNLNIVLKNATKYITQEIEDKVKNEKCLLDKLVAASKYRKILQNLHINGISNIHGMEKDKYTISFCYLYRGANKFTLQHYSQYESLDIRSNNDYAFIENDVGEITNKMKRRLRYYVKDNKNVHLIEIKDPARVTELFGDIPLKLSQIPDPPRAPRSKPTGGVSIPIRRLSDSRHSNLMYEWSETAIDTTNACCVPRKGMHVIWKGSIYKPDFIRNIAYGLGYTNVYGISDGRFESLKKKYKLESLEDVAKDRAEKVIQALDTFALANSQYPRKFVGQAMDFKKMKGLSTECDNFIALHKCNKQLDVYMQLANTFNLSVPVAPDYQKEFYDKYPLLLDIDWYSGTIKADHIVNYIKLVEGL